MEIITKNFEVYGVEELSCDAFEKAKNNYYNDINDDRCCWFCEDCEYILKDDFDIDAKIQFDLSYSQGDGFSFDCDKLLTDKVYNHLKNKFTKQQKFIIKFLKDYGYKFFTKHYHNYYNFASKNDVDDDIDIYSYNHFKNFYPFSKLKDDDYYKNIEKIKDILIDFYIDICKKFKDDGYNYLYDYNDDEFVDWCKDNEIKFLKNGDIF